MAELFTLGNLFTLAILILLETVLGFDNLLYISIESKRVSPEKQAMVRRVGLTLAIVLRIVLLFAVLNAIQYFKDPFFNINFPGILEGEFNVHAFIVLVGGAFIIYTATKEITHMLSVHDLSHEGHGNTAKRSLFSAIFWITLMNFVFSIDSVLSAIALTDVFWVMAPAIIISGILMIVMADTVSTFLERNRMYEVLGLFVLFMIGILLVSEGGHLAHLKVFGYPIEAMSKATFYFVLFVLVVVEIVQGRYQKKLLLEKQAAQINDPNITAKVH
jgi:predicted tellurium resistance membrane protein TerC